MKTIIAGSRNIVDYTVILRAIQNSHFKISTVICGGARGVDLLGGRWAKENGVPIEYYFPDWNKFSKKAGFLRNETVEPRI